MDETCSLERFLILIYFDLPYRFSLACKNEIGLSIRSLQLRNFARLIPPCIQRFNLLAPSLRRIPYKNIHVRKLGIFFRSNLPRRDEGKKKHLRNVIILLCAVIGELCSKTISLIFHPGIVVKI